MQVAFNGQHYCDYRHRIPKERITHVIVVGDIQLQNMITTAGGPTPPAVTECVYNIHRSIVRPSVCPVDRQQQRLQPYKLSINRPLCCRRRRGQCSAANASSVTLRAEGQGSTQACHSIK